MNYAEALAQSRNFLTLDDVALLKELAGQIGEGSVIDLGAGSGTTALAVLEANPLATVFTYDISQDSLNSTEQAIKNAGFEHRWEGACIPAVSAASRWRLERLSLVLLDASHLYEETCDELAAWVPLVRPGGWIWCHDYEGAGGLPGTNGVRQAVDEFLASKKRKWITGGLGIAIQV